MEIERIKQERKRGNDGCIEADEFLGEKSSCLTCPFNHCVLDTGGTLSRIKRKERNQEIVKLVANGVSINEIVHRFNICARTVQRITTRSNNE